MNDLPIEQQIFLTLNNITKSMNGLKEDVLFVQKQMIEEIRGIDERLKELEACIQK